MLLQKSRKILLLILSWTVSSLGCNHPVISMIPNKIYTLSTPEFTNYHEDTRTQCYYRYVAPSNYRIKVNCDVVDMENSQNCQYANFYTWTALDINTYNHYCNRTAEGVEMVTEDRHFSALFVNHIPNNRNQSVHVQCRMNSEPSNATPESCDCGSENANRQKIVGGTETGVNQYPFLVFLILKIPDFGSKSCTSSILSETFLLTAAHCLEAEEKIVSPTYVGYLLGAHDLTTTSLTDFKFNAEEVIVHEGYNSATIDNDIGLVRLKEPIQFSSKVSPVCLPYKINMAEMDKEKVTVIGWGKELHSNTARSDVLRHVQLKVLNETACKVHPIYRQYLTDNMVCTQEDGKNICQGDSGGPLVYKQNGRNILIGISSWVFQCSKELPGVYARVTNYLDWIEKKTEQRLCNP